jgi:Ca2+-binding EF-hand superfamily protein
MAKVSDWRVRIDEVTPPVLPDVGSLAFPPRPPVEGPDPVYGIENLSFEGGGSKGIAYCGALRLLEEQGIYPDHVHRVAGTSSGSFLAAMVAMGMRSDELIELLYSTDLVALMNDARFGKVGAMWNIFRTLGMNPGEQLLAFLGDRLEERTGSANVTFKQLFDRCGRELCVPITNLTRMCTEYCHPKTTPDMPVRLAVGMSMSLPVLMRPYRILRNIAEGIEEEDLYTDGGLLCNYPLHAFDGWWLSRKASDAFLHRLRPLNELGKLVHERFHPRNEATLGLTVFDVEDIDASAHWVLAEPPDRPVTKLAKERSQKEAENDRRCAAQIQLEEAMGRLMDAMAAVETDGDGMVSRAECLALFDSGAMSRDDAMSLFHTADPAAIFERLDENQDGQISYDELLRFMDSHNVDLTARAFGTRLAEPGSFPNFMSLMMKTMLVHIRQQSLHHEDKYRTIAINTDYVGTADFELEDADRAFLLETGERATRAFLERRKARRGAAE